MILNHNTRWGILLLATSIFYLGCGSNNEVNRTAISGKVTFNGQPIPYGLIYFMPDTSQGNSGPQGFAEITNGQYKTDKVGFGSVAGPLIIRINGFSEKRDPSSEEGATQLFPQYQTKVTLEEGETTMDFDVPGN